MRSPYFVKHAAGNTAAAQPTTSNTPASKHMPASPRVRDDDIPPPSTLREVRVVLQDASLGEDPDTMPHRRATRGW